RRESQHPEFSLPGGVVRPRPGEETEEHLQRRRAAQQPGLPTGPHTARPQQPVESRLAPGGQDRGRRAVRDWIARRGRPRPRAHPARGGHLVSGPVRGGALMTRGVRTRLVLFVILSAVGIVYVTGNYLGLVDRVLGRGFTVHATLPDSGGLYEGSSVTYRG